jgi:hypothetical protein
MQAVHQARPVILQRHAVEMVRAAPWRVADCARAIAVRVQGCVAITGAKPTRPSPPVPATAAEPTASRFACLPALHSGVRRDRLVEPGELAKRRKHVLRDVIDRAGGEPAHDHVELEVDDR